jgi:hypothetical protein
VFVLGTMLVHEPAAGLPHISDVLLGLTSVSAAGYAGKKLLPSEPVTATLASSKGKGGDSLAITVKGVSAASDQEAKFSVRFGAEPGKTATASVVNKVAEFEVRAPGPPAPPKPVNVTVVTEAGAMLDAGTFEYE